MTAAAAVEKGLVDVGSPRFAKPIQDVHYLTSRVIARFLITGEGTTEKERNFIGRVGVMGAWYGLSIATLTRSYLLWRDTNLRILNEEVDRLGIGQAVQRWQGRSSSPVRTRASCAWLAPTTIRSHRSLPRSKAAAPVQIGLHRNGSADKVGTGAGWGRSSWNYLRSLDPPPPTRLPLSRRPASGGRRRAGRWDRM